MVRPCRIHYSGAVYHVTARGNNREDIFLDGDDKHYYLSLLKKYKEKFNFSLYAYVLMDNHLHLLIEVASHPLYRIMQGIQQAYSKNFNRQHGRVGHVFQKRYDARICTEDSYLLSVLKYIHFNPIKAGITDNLNYQWSSHESYIRGNSTFIDVYKILGFFTKNPDQSILQYIDFMQVIDEIDLEEQLEKAPLVKILEKDQVAYPLVSKEEFFQFISRETNSAIAILLSGSRVRNIVAIRKIMIYVAIKCNIATTSELTALLKVSSTVVSRSYYEVLQNKESLREAEQLIRKITQ